MINEVQEFIYASSQVFFDFDLGIFKIMLRSRVIA